MSTDKKLLNSKAVSFIDETGQFLSELITFKSVGGNETGAMEYLYGQFSEFDSVEVEKVYMDNSIKNDYYYSCPAEEFDYSDTYNLRIVRKGTGSGKSIILNTHVDVVPAGEMVNPWDGICEDGAVFGRGAVDAKGQIATIFLLFKLLENFNIKTAGDVIVHIVVEEESGGNGTLAMVRNVNEEAEGCINLEPTSGKLMVSIRAAVWFKITLQGKSGHSGSSQTVNPIWMAHEVMSILKDYHSDLLNKLKSQKYYDQYENPMPLTFGKIYAGDWPSSCPDEAVIEGVLGFLPGMTEKQVCEGIKQTLLDNGSLLNEGNFDVKFTYRHNCCVIDEENVLVKDIIKAANRVDVNIEKAAMTASTDAWYYSEIAGVKAVAFGPGQLSCCHSSNESIKLTEIVDAGKILFESVKIFCG